MTEKVLDITGKSGLETCDLCGDRALEAAYTPDGGARGLRVCVCRRCGLVQSLPRRSGKTRRTPLASGGADWGNIRYGKAFRTKAAMDLLGNAIDLSRIEKCLDIGANRGSFVEALRKENPGCFIAAVEPDSSVTSAYASAEGVELMEKRFEECEFEGETFDFVYCCHTLEHVESPRKVLSLAFEAMRPGGVLYLDVPDISLAGASDMVEEFFIDKHLYHFSSGVVQRLVEASGFKTLARTSDGENMVIVAGKPESIKTTSVTLEDRAEAGRNLALVKSYSETRARNLEGLKRAGEFLNTLAGKKVVVWGGGRLFDCLMKYGFVRPGVIDRVVDRYLPEHLSSVHGFALARPSDLKPGDAEHLVIMSRAYAEEIRAEAKEALGPDVTVHEFKDLLTGPEKAASNE